MLAQQQPLQRELYALGRMRAARRVRALAALVVDRRGARAFGLDQIEFGDDAERGGFERHRARMDALAIGQRLGRQFAAGAVDLPVYVLAVDGVGAVGPFLLHPHQVREPRAVHVFVDHARRQRRHGGEGGVGVDRHVQNTSGPAGALRRVCGVAGGISRAGRSTA